jgi:hypothetical protein
MAAGFGCRAIMKCGRASMLPGFLAIGIKPAAVGFGLPAIGSDSKVTGWRLHASGLIDIDMASPEATLSAKPWLKKSNPFEFFVVACVQSYRFQLS